MKPRGIPGQSKGKQESHVDDGQHKETSERGLKTVITNPLQNKPLIGKSFYLDLPFNKKTETLEKDIKILGGTIEKFFSKDIKYLVSKQKEARYVQSLGRNSPVPSPVDSGHSSPHPSSRRGSQKGSSLGPVDAVITSRGKSLVEKVIKEQERIQINRILSNALEWGIKILYIDDVISYIEKKKGVITAQQQNNVAIPVGNKMAKTRTAEQPAFQKYDAGRISKPFVKVEDCSRHYRPIYLHIQHLPRLSLTSLPPCSPFLAVEDGKGSPSKKLNEHRNNRSGGQKAAAREACRPTKAKRKAPDARVKKRGGYCECCLVKYENVKAHLNSEQHKVFSKGAEYHVVDRAISELTCRLAEIQQQLKRPKCSMSSVVHTTGTRAKFEGRKEAYVKFEHSVGEGTWASFVGNPAASTTPSSAGAAVACRLRNCSVVLRSSSQGSEAPNLSPKMVKPHIAGASNRLDSHEYNQMAQDAQGRRSVPDLGKPSDRSPEKNLGLIGGEQRNKRTCEVGCLSQNVDEDFHCLPPPKSLKTTSSKSVSVTSTKQTQEPLMERERNHCRLNNTSNERAGDNTIHHGRKAESPSGRRLQRKVRNFRRRRKVKRTPKHTDKEDTHSGSLQNLWQLFQSSEDKDFEFKGFAV